MNVPLCVTINFRTWGIELVESNSQMMRASDGKLHYGCCHYHNRKICLDKEIDMQRTYSTLAHELSHAFLAETQLSEKETYTEEKLCWFVAQYGEKIIDMTLNVMERIGELR